MFVLAPSEALCFACSEIHGPLRKQEKTLLEIPILYEIVFIYPIFMDGIIETNRIQRLVNGP